jgi:hypothetical protein
MRNYILAGLILLTASFARAQSDSKVDVFGGYSYFNQDTNGATDRLNLNGWTASATYNFHKYLGATAEFSGEYGSPTIASVSTTDHQHTFLFGPTVNFLRTDKLTLFGHALFGVADSSLSVAGVSSTDNGFAMALGGGADYNLNKRFGVRLAQVDWMRTSVFGTDQNNFRYSGGVVVHF